MFSCGWLPPAFRWHFPPSESRSPWYKAAVLPIGSVDQKLPTGVPELPPPEEHIAG